MNDITFTMQLFTSMIAICGAYALIMSILQKQVNKMWVRGEAVLATLSAGLSVWFMQPIISASPNTFMLLSAAALIVGVFLGLAAVILHRLNVKSTQEYPTALIPQIRWIAILMFGTLTLHFMLELAALAWK
jgi:hypothetical protein